MFDRDVRASFSESWHRVAETRPRLSPHAHVIRQRFGAETAYIVEDPAGGHYYRMSESAFLFLGMLDGRASVDQAWESCCRQLGDAAPSQRECMRLLAQLQLFGLLSGSEPIAPDMVTERVRQAKSERFHRRTGRFIFPTIPLLNPEPALARLEWLCRAVFSRLSLIVWLIVAGLSLSLVLPRWREFGDGLSEILDPANLVVLGGVFIVIRAIHEFGHAMACKAMGGRCTEIGVILVALVIPLPYCDASSAWRFPDTWRRVLVSAAGMLVESFFASIAGIVWALTTPQDAPLAHAIAFNIMVVSGVATFIFNANPLLRYDGYYILTDLTGVPNLAQRSKDIWKYLIERFAFGLRNLDAPWVRARGELWLILVYGVLSPPYRLFIGISILLLVASRFFTLGLVLAAVLAVLWFVWPVLKGLAYLLGSSRLMGKRGRAVGVSALGAAALLALIGVVPFPSGATAYGVIEPVRRGVLRAGESGVILRVLASAGDEVREGEPLIEIENRELIGELEATSAQLARARVDLDRAIAESPIQAGLAAKRVGALEDRLERVRRRVEGLTIRAPVSGRLVAMGGAGVDLDNLTGRYVPRGSLLAMVASTEELRIRAVISDRDRAYVFPGADDAEAARVPATIRVRGRAGVGLDGHVTRLAPAAGTSLADDALSVRAGGRVVMDPTDPAGERTLVPYFLVEVTPEASLRGAQPGQRAHVRFRASPQPIAAQVWRRLRQYVSERLSI
ncbi:MAG: hypothetical protein H6811_10080 [Phycisphaeraceae bacterium]|nr:hypothetical protein [Phycisphaeraceae bacterium]